MRAFPSMLKFSCRLNLYSLQIQIIQLSTHLIYPGNILPAQRIRSESCTKFCWRQWCQHLTAKAWASAIRHIISSCRWRSWRFDQKPAKEKCFIRRLPPHSQVLTNVQYGFVFIATSGATVFDCRQASGDFDVSQIKAVSMIPDPYYRICRFACGFGKCELIIYSSSGSKPTLNSSALFGVLSIANWLIILFPASGIYLYETPFRVKPLAILDAPVSARFASVCKLATSIISQRVLRLFTSRIKGLWLWVS